MIPIFRAKKINGDEYAEGCLNVWEQNKKVYYSIMEIGIYPSPFNDIHLIDQTTLAIHFPDMLDSQGNKIFASLQEDGKGGDILEFSSNYFGDYTTVLYFKNHRLITHSKTTKENTIRNKESLSSSRVIGIQQ